MSLCLIFSFLSLVFPLDFAGTANNAGAILVLGRDLVVVPKLIHPLPPAINSPETSPERHGEDTWMQVMSQRHYKNQSLSLTTNILIVLKTGT